MELMLVEERKEEVANFEKITQLNYHVPAEVSLTMTSC
jgi:hypothetical protein